VDKKIKQTLPQEGAKGTKNENSKRIIPTL
jgi:hypothetical protein